MAKWDVVPREGLDAGGFYMQRSCHHRTGRDSLSACGGCFARAVEALTEIERTGDASLAKIVRDAARAEGLALQSSKRKRVSP